MNAPPLSLYVHFPWCVRKCPYCDFNSYTAGEAAPRSRYLDALEKDLALEARRVGDRPLTSVFLGGGTPSFFAPAEIARVLAAIDTHFRLAGDAEITMEANPGTIECGEPAGYRAAGVNRLSIGAQTFDPSTLVALGRIHSAGDIVRAVQDARDGGFDNLNLDLMYALPGQDVDGALADLDSALALGPEHLSWYQLTLEPNTVFHARPPANLPDGELAADIQEAGGELLAARGFERYEVSAWSRPDRRCRHNLNYWTFGDYAAAGAGAHGKLTSNGEIRRYAKPANPLSYMADIESREEAAATGPALGPDERLFEFLLNGLRLADGFDERLFASRAGLPASALAARAGDAVRRGLIERSPGGHWKPTERGARYLDDLVAGFLP